jgi:dienelactone hydrolase
MTEHPNESTVTATQVRSLFWAAKVNDWAPPFDTAHLKVFYRARPTWSAMEKMSGSLAVDETIGVAPFVVVVPGINVNPDSYRWLASDLATVGYVVVVMTLIGRMGPTAVGLTSGIDMRFGRPETWGQQTTAPALNDVVSALTVLNETPNQPLFGHLDTANVSLIGHSAGGAAVLQNTRHQYFPWIRSAVTYAGHSLGSVMLGWPEGSVTPVHADCPILMIGGTADGVIAASASRYGEDAATRSDPLRRTFAAITGPRSADARLVIIDGATHFAISHPIDPTCARSFLDEVPVVDLDAVRSFISELIITFLDSTIRNTAPAAERLERLDARFQTSTSDAAVISVAAVGEWAK